MRAFIVGAGAVGQYLAARLRLGGHDVVLLGRRDTVDALRSNGITLRAGDQQWPVSVVAVADPAEAREPFELAIVAVKSFATPEAIASLRGAPGCRDSTILTVQNGLGNEEALADAFGRDRIAAGALTTAVERTNAWTIIATPRGGLSFAPVGDAPHNWLIPALQNTGLEVRAAGDWRSLKWSKLCINLMANGVCAALDWTPAQVYADKMAFSIERACLAEAVSVMRRLNIAPVALIDFPVPLLVTAVRTLSEGLLRAVLSKRVVSARGDKLPSLLLDLRAGKRQTEVGELNGAVAPRGAKAGVPAPANTAVTRVVESIAGQHVEWSTFRGKPAALAALIGD